MEMETETMEKKTTTYLMPVGRFRGRPIAEVPDHYLQTCATSSITAKP